MLSNPSIVLVRQVVGSFIQVANAFVNNRSVLHGQTLTASVFDNSLTDATAIDIKSAMQFGGEGYVQEKVYGSFDLSMLGSYTRPELKALVKSHDRNLPIYVKMKVVLDAIEDMNGLTQVPFRLDVKAVYGFVREKMTALCIDELSVIPRTPQSGSTFKESMLSTCCKVYNDNYEFSLSDKLSNPRILGVDVSREESYVDLVSGLIDAPMGLSNRHSVILTSTEWINLLYGNVPIAQQFTNIEPVISNHVVV